MWVSRLIWISKMTASSQAPLSTFIIWLIKTNGRGLLGNRAYLPVVSVFPPGLSIAGLYIKSLRLLRLEAGNSEFRFVAIMNGACNEPAYVQTSYSMLQAERRIYVCSVKAPRLSRSYISSFEFCARWFGTGWCKTTSF